MEEYRRLYTYGVDTLGQAYELHCLPYECSFSIFRGRPLISEIMNGYFRGTSGLEGVHNFHSTAARCPPYLGLFYCTKKNIQKFQDPGFRIPDPRSVGSISGIIAPLSIRLYSRRRETHQSMLFRWSIHDRACKSNVTVASATPTPTQLTVGWRGRSLVWRKSNRRDNFGLSSWNVLVTLHQNRAAVATSRVSMIDQSWNPEER